MPLRLRFLFDSVDYLNDVQDIVRGFSPYVETEEDATEYLKAEYRYDGGIFAVEITSSFDAPCQCSLTVADNDVWEYKRQTKRFLKNAIYNYLCVFLRIKLPYGSLTGVRPTKLFYELRDSISNVKGYLIDTFDVSPSRASLIESIVQNQESVYDKSEGNADIFVNIPFCPTRCAYCSFISTEVFRIKKRLPLYVEKVGEELEKIKREIVSRGMKLRSIYVGGGTPTSIGVNNLDGILAPLKDLGVEFTVEAGRPDTVTEEMLDMLKKNNVTRISVNPQTFKQETLDIIGRKHSIEDVFRAFEWAKERGFDVNMDLIALLPGESLSDFECSIEKAVSLRPENVTVHTLSLKRGAALSKSSLSEVGLAMQMVDFARDALAAAGYEPYYMYRQKNMADNLENVGYALPGKANIYNVAMMEETDSIFGAGAGAMSKTVQQGLIERRSNPKGFNEYLERPLF